MKRTASAVLACACTLTTLALAPAKAVTIHFDNLPLAPESSWNGSDGAGGFSVVNTRFNNTYSETYGSWSGFAYSNTTDTETAGWENQFSAITGKGVGTSANYAIAYFSTYGDPEPTITFGDLTTVGGITVTNTTYATLSMQEGDFFAKKFGGDSRDEEDWFLLTITGYANGVATGSIPFYLADFRFSDNSLDYILTDWALVDLSSLGPVNEIRFSMTSSDVGENGINTPTYFALGDIQGVPEPSAAVLALAGLALAARRRR